jgi:hypothetical protein
LQEHIDGLVENQFVDLAHFWIKNLGDQKEANPLLSGV